MRPHEHSIRRFRTRVAGLLALRYTLVLAAVWGFAWGLAVLFLRAAFGTERQPLLWGLLGFAVAVVAAAVAAVRRMPARRSVRALLDKVSNCGGLLMAGEETDLGPWRDAMPAIERPRIIWRSGQTWCVFCAAAAFVLLGFAIPQRYVDMNAARPPLDVTDDVARIKEQIELLEEEAIIEEQRAETLEQKLDQTAADASGTEPGKTLEALDHLEQELRKGAEEAAEAALAQAEQLAAAENLAAQLDQAAGQLDEKDLAQAMKELSALMEQALSENESLLNEALDEKLLNACKDGKLCQADLAKLCKACQLSKDQLSEMVKKLAEAKMIDAEMMAKCEGCSQCNNDRLLAFLAKSGMNACEGIATGNCPGRGAVTRGRGDAALTWKDPSTKENTEFQEQVLPPNLAGLKDSTRVGVSLSAPKVEDVGSSSGGALGGAATGSGSAFTAKVLPRHKGAVKRYFERQ